jgi:signal transduction histidine kinase
MKQLRSFIESAHFEIMFILIMVMMISLCSFLLFNNLTTFQVDSLTPQFQQIFFAKELQGFSTEAAFYLKPPLDQKALQTWLENKVENSQTTVPLTLAPSRGVLQCIGVVDQEMRVVAIYGPQSSGINKAAYALPKLSSSANALLTDTLREQKNSRVNSVIESGQTIFMAVPISGSDGHIQGALFLQTKIVPPERMIAFNVITAFASVPSYFLHIFPFIIFMGILFYYVSYHWGRRFNQLTKAVSSWSQGDFSIIIQENKSDKIGHLAQDLNGMVQQLQRFIVMKQELAASNERNHLARELHDTVKQMVFALSFQLEIARKLHSENDQLTLHLQEAQHILKDIQKEMNNLIFPMRQTVLENKDLTDALARYLSKWSYQYGIFVKYTTDIQGQEKNFALSARVKETFFRVTQEALSNVARHSKASSVQVTLTIGWLYITLKITDDGEGFDYIKKKEHGMGLSSMEERMEAIGGYLQITSIPPSGTEVTATYTQKDAGPNIAEIPTTRKIERPSYLLPFLATSQQDPETSPK